VSPPVQGGLTPITSHSKDKTMNTNTNIRHPTRSARSTVVRGCVAVAMTAASVAAVGAMTPATATFRDPGPGSMRAAVSEAKKSTSSDDSVTFPYVVSPCFDGRPTDRWAADVGAPTKCVHIYGAPETYVSAGGPAAGPVAQMIDINTYEEFVATWPFVAPKFPYPKRF
jgi:hypothetical protein